MMHKVETIQQAGDDRMLHLAIPVDEAKRRYQVTVLVRPVPDASEPGSGWPPGFFEQTAGSIQDETFFRHEQGQLEERLGFE
ncbi:MAG: hypothetical protein B7Z73_03505 [Planctomycetia bacterium 21-64-5]|nr:MAG: hypothetical protein B7Z73_03505 [Planctomycetia bacterium 21-64-5]HQU42108.1 hypothetical protein [Pirellulales bacterium]